MRILHQPATQRESGSILIYAMITMTVMLAIGLTLTALFIAKLRSAGATRNATVAIYAADSGVEMCLYEARAAVNDAPLVFASGAMLEIKDAVPPNPDITDDCSVLAGLPLGFRSTGKFRSTQRTLEISY
jgi:hypothetical protein